MKKSLEAWETRYATDWWLKAYYDFTKKHISLKGKTPIWITICCPSVVWRLQGYQQKIIGYFDFLPICTLRLFTFALCSALLELYTSDFWSFGVLFDFAIWGLSMCVLFKDFMDLAQLHIEVDPSPGLRRGCFYMHSELLVLNQKFGQRHSQQ